MKAFDTNPELKWLFVMTHPDDEMSIAAWIRRLVRAGSEVHMLWAHSNETREEESRQAANLIGVSSDHLEFFELPDGRLVEHLNALRAGLKQRISTHNYDRVAVTAFEQGHLDHDSVCYAVSRVFSGPILQYPMYYPYTRTLQVLQKFSSCNGVHRLELDPSEAEFKWKLLGCYPSQTIRRNAICHKWMLSWVPGQEPLDRREYLRVQPGLKFDRVNHPSPVKDEVERSQQWRKWLRHWQEDQ